MSFDCTDGNEESLRNYCITAAFDNQL